MQVTHLNQKTCKNLFELKTCSMAHARCCSKLALGALICHQADLQRGIKTQAVNHSVCTVVSSTGCRWQKCGAARPALQDQAAADHSMHGRPSNILSTRCVVLIRMSMVVQVAINRVLQDKRFKNRELQMPQVMDLYAKFAAQDAWS